MLIQEVIRKKREGLPLDDAEIEAFVQGIVDESISEGQISAFAMATYFTDMQTRECMTLTRSMQNSGVTLAWDNHDLTGPVVDKHSSGGVGDKVSIMLAPMLAACGTFVPMISGRGLGHTGGTLDKLDSIPGYSTSPDINQLQTVVRQVGCAIVGQTAELAPADKRFYAIRDVTATVESLPLIVASILSKKLSAGLDCLVMDVKTGSGAFADTYEKAEDLASRIVETGGGLGLPTSALITDMSQVLGRSVGNALEILEVIDYLQGEHREVRLHEVVIALGAELLMLSGVVARLSAGEEILNERLADGSAAETFAKMISALGGPADLMQKPQAYLGKAPVICPVYASRTGKIAAMDVRSVGNCVVELGGGRRRIVDNIDYRVGLTEVKSIGESVDAGTPIAFIHAGTQAAADAIAAQIQAAVTVDESGPDLKPVILNRLTHRHGKV